MADGHGLFFRSLDLQDGDEPELSRIWLDIHSGFSEPADVRGDDLVIPQKHGMAEMDRYKHRRIIELRGHVRGDGPTVLERQQDWRAATEVLMAVMDFTLASGLLEVVPPYMGLLSVSQSISARAFDAIGGPILGKQTFQRWTFRLVAIGDPPDWVEDESS